MQEKELHEYAKKSTMHTQKRAPCTRKKERHAHAKKSPVNVSMHTQRKSPMNVGQTAESDVSVKEPCAYAEKSSMNMQKRPMNVGQRAELDVCVKEHYVVASTSSFLQ